MNTTMPINTIKSPLQLESQYFKLSVARFLLVAITWFVPKVTEPKAVPKLAFLTVRLSSGSVSDSHVQMTKLADVHRICLTDGLEISSVRELINANRCRLNRSMQHSSNLLIRLCFSKRPDPLGCTQLNLDRTVFSLNQRSRTNLAVETPAGWTRPIETTPLTGYFPNRCCEQGWLLKNLLTRNLQKLDRVRKLYK